jgi:hypothetical protein
MDPTMTDPDRLEPKRYPLLQAPVYFSRVGFGWWRRKRRRIAPALAGVRVLTDVPVERGDPLRVEIFLADGSSVACRMEVAWVESLPDGGPARYEVGLDFTALLPGDRDRLSPALGPAPA